MKPADLDTGVFKTELYTAVWVNPLYTGVDTPKQVLWQTVKTQMKCSIIVIYLILFSETCLPRYVRINTLKTSSEIVVKVFQELGWLLVDCTKDR